MSQHNFSAASASWCCDQSFHFATYLYSGYVATLSCIICIFVATLKVVSRQRLVATELNFLLQLCFLCCDLDFYVGDVLHVTTPICFVATTLFFMQHLFLLRPSFSGHDITFLPLACLHVSTLISCHDRTFLYSADFYVAT